jgi:transglutaminase-like putative cysteine protease
MSLPPDPGRRIPLAPPEGWLTLGLVLLLCLSLAWSLDDAMLVLGRDEYTDFLNWAVPVGGVLAGFLGAAVGWGRWRTYVIGSLFAALLIPILVGSVVIPEGAHPGLLFRATAEEVVLAWSDLIVANRFSTSAYGHHLLVLGLLVWASSMFASFAAFGHRRPLNAVLLIGTLLVANMAVTTRDQLVYLVLYSLAALFLLIRFHIFDEQADWIRRRIGDPSAISGMYLRGGTVFIVAAVLGSLLLTSVASSAPLAGAWTDLGGRAIEWTQFLQRYLPESGSGRTIGPSFGSTARIGDRWTTNDGPALTWETPPTELERPYLAAVIYDEFELYGWRISERTSVPRATDEELLLDTGDAVAPAGRRELTMTITPELSRSIVFTPQMPLRIGQEVTVELIGDDGFLARIERSTSDAPYSVTALIRAPEQEGGPTKFRLRAAGQDYPEEIRERYGKAAVPEGTFTTPEARALLDDIVARSDPNPYDIAATMVATLQDPARFQYSTDISDVPCGELSIVDCFAVHRQGFCEYYASTMAMMLRELDIPARFVEGFLPGRRDLASGVSRVANNDAHAWVQVYFPGYGWIDFDPTGGNRSALEPLPSGRPEATPVASPSATGVIRPLESELPDRSEPDDSDAGAVPGSGGSSGPLIVMAILLAVVVGAVAAVAWRRGPRGPVTADGAYGMVTRLASRFGFGPRPNQTIYEYAGALAEVLPAARPELETVAQAKVEVVYGGRDLGPDRLAALREAQRRLRTSLLALAFRRDRGRRRR